MQEYHQQVGPGGFGVQGPGARLTVYAAPPRYHLRVYQPLPPPGLDALRSRLEQPSSLLRADREVIPFTGRQRLIADFTGWRDGPGERAAQLLHGPGGQGKTRLARHLSAQAVVAGWAVVWARHAADRPEPGPSAQPEPDARLLLVVDYAERWPAGDLTQLLVDQIGERRAATRVLLLARSAQWWPLAAAELDRLDVAVTVAALPPLAATQAEQVQLLGQARDRYAEIYQYRDPAGLALRPPTEPDAGQALSLHMVALAAVDAAYHTTRPPEQPQDVTAYLLNREREYWAKMHGSDRVSALARITFVAALTGQLPNATAVSTLDTLGLPAAIGMPAQQLVDTHRGCYPGDAALQPLYPDRLAEDFVALSLPGHDRDYLADPWCAELVVTPAEAKGEASRLGRLFACDPGAASPAYTGRALTYLAAAAARWPHAGRYLSNLISADPGLAVCAGGSALAAVAAVADPPVLVEVNRHLPGRPDLDLDVAAALVAERITPYLFDQADDADKAQLQQNLSWRYGRAGRAEEALTLAEDAVARWRDIADRDPSSVANAANLANGLDNLGNRLSDLGREEEAARCAQEAVARLTPLARVHPRAEVALAKFQDNLASRLTGLGEYEQAATLNAEAIEVLRRRAEVDRQHRRALALALNHRCTLMLSLKQLDAAREAGKEAADLYRQLVEVEPDAVLPNLGASLSNLAGATADPAEAVSLVREAVDHFRQTATHPKHGSDLAGGLINLGLALHKAGQRQQAADALWEAAEVLAADPIPADRRKYAVQVFTLVRVLPAITGDPEQVVDKLEPLLDRTRDALGGAKAARSGELDWMLPPSLQALQRQVRTAPLSATLDQLAPQHGVDVDAFRTALAQLVDVGRFTASRKAATGEARPLTGSELMQLPGHARFMLGPPAPAAD